jgi:hypothetical protein
VKRVGTDIERTIEVVNDFLRTGGGRIEAACAEAYA